MKVLVNFLYAFFSEPDIFSKTLIKFNMHKLITRTCGIRLGVTAASFSARTLADVKLVEPSRGDDFYFVALLIKYFL